MITPATSAAAAQLAAHYRIMGGWDNSQAIAEAIENNDSQELIRLCRGLSPDAMRIIDRILQVMVNRRNLRHA
ncbi:hypothetical protein [Dolichospermum sp. UHCC 0259]|uniref:hypothetical protein n=1 Tax=Dolichospermum sp. UHCC 0259 TaxID=2590010 RepID=UPI001446453C|nr:hypothetical protein [Dolichospermum sp. UHCC 0259]MTJ48388.1 hypothetical protein [Dolichospermum sp. UHCC 0259]